MSSVIERIRAAGHWDIAIRPHPFDEGRVEYDRLDEVLASSTVRLRGWPLPYIDPREPMLHGEDWLGQDIDASSVDHLEAWRIFTSGQFTQLRSVAADLRGTSVDATPIPAGFAA